MVSPRARVSVFPAMVGLALVLLTALGVSGTSSGVIHRYLHGDEPDPRLLRGSPLVVRSDEWLVQTPIAISQAGVGLPAVSDVFAGGQDLTLALDAPTRSWPTIGRPHDWGFVVGLPLARAFAWRWWLPAAEILLATYLLSLTLLPKRPVVAAGVAVGLWAAPMVQWWWQPSTTTSVAGSLLAVTCILRLLAPEGCARRAWWAALLAWATFSFGLALYPPFQIACLLPALGLAVGALLRCRAAGALRLGILLAPLAGVAAGGVALLTFLATRWDAVQATLHTDYPGARFEHTGGFGLSRAMAGTFAHRLQAPDLRAEGPLLAQFGGNASEASACLLVGLFCLPVLIAQARVARRRGEPPDHLALGVLAATAVMLADVFIAGLDPLARLTGLSLVPHPRLGLGLGVASSLLLLLAIRGASRTGWKAAGGLGLAAAGVPAVEAWRLHSTSPAVVGSLRGQALVCAAVALAAAAAALGRRGAGAVAAGMVAAVALVSTAGVHPLYRGVLDLRTSPLGRAITEADRAAPGGWVSTVGVVSQAFLAEAGVRTYSGVFTYPVAATWAELDPTGASRHVWNRYATVQWSERAPLPVSNPTPDQVLVRLEPCGAFAQRRLRHVLSGRSLDGVGCTRLERTVVDGRRTFYVYRVTPPAG